MSQKKVNTTNDPNDPRNILKAFISHDPTAQYNFDSERDSPQSEICRQGGPRGTECITLQMQSKRLFQAMQDHGFFCALPMDPGRTHMECRPIPQ
ncbi:hypothetical protein BDZ94DRAFT_1313065 [Collybia nuda]|uniref:Uncharacterized protein n=1 Tax=Collybia nuda TaxID=64659 RepID=A0A9P6CF59_9AGAR|nr:hypothetical protein BDZ94DRAFT_1313065 [Collybia nuda]